MFGWDHRLPNLGQRGSMPTPGVPAGRRLIGAYPPYGQGDWKPKVTDFGRFAEPSLLILTSLSDGPKHGYAIMQDVEQGTGRPMGAGTLYAALIRLEEQGLVEPLAPVDRRRPYRLTAVGAADLAEQLRGLSEFAQQGLRQLGETQP